MHWDFGKKNRRTDLIMNFEIKTATRVGINPLIVAYSESGCGKTYSALLLARGMAGASGKIVVADSESGRASLYADVLPGGFETFDLAAPFAPARYVEAVDAIESSGAAVGIIDSGSHEWEGIGGVLDMAGEIEQRTGKTGLHCWKAPKFEHAKFVQRLLRTKIPIIVCLRAKYKTRQTKNEQGKTVLIKDEATSPIQAEDFIFEATCHFEILQNHSIILTKCSHPSLRDCFPKDKTTPIMVGHGMALAEWCNAAGKPPVAKKATTGDEISHLKKILWDSTKHIHSGDKSALEQWLWDEVLMEPDKHLESLTAAELTSITNLVEKKLKGQK
jgi:hypothetical protein